MWALQTQAWGSLHVLWSSLDMFSASSRFVTATVWQHEMYTLFYARALQYRMVVSLLWHSPRGCARSVRLRVHCTVEAPCRYGVTPTG